MALLIAGCEEQTPEQSLPAPAAPPVKLRVLVVEDPELGEAIQREWHSRTENDVAIASVSKAELVSASRLPGDVVVFPSSLLGQLVERNLIRPLGEPLLASESVALLDILPITRRDEITWGQETYALPLGSSQLVLAYRSDLLARLNLAVPATWEDYQAAVSKLADRSLLGEAAPPEDQPWRAAAEPMGAGFGGSLLLARAAAYANHRDQATPLFDTTKLEPLIDRPPYVRALTELAASKPESGLPPVASPQDAMSELLSGRCGMALCWPSGEPLASETTKTPPIGFAELPSSRAVFNFRSGRWEERWAGEDQHVPFVGTSGRFASVTASTGQVAAAEGLVGWLSGSEVSSRVATRSSGTTLFRASHRSQLGHWVGNLPADAAEQYFDVVRQSQSRARSMNTVRLPGADRYLAALDAAVQRTTVEGQDPKASLEQAAEDWRKITADIGIAAQGTAIRRSLRLGAD